MIVIPAKAGIYSPAARPVQGGKTGETEYRITDLQQGKSRSSRLSGNPADSKFVAPAKAGAQRQVTEILDSAFAGMTIKGGKSRMCGIWITASFAGMRWPAFFCAATHQSEPRNCEHQLDYTRLRGGDDPGACATGLQPRKARNGATASLANGFRRRSGPPVRPEQRPQALCPGSPAAQLDAAPAPDRRRRKRSADDGGRDSEPPFHPAFDPD
jgi:hypothetical protein